MLAIPQRLKTAVFLLGVAAALACGGADPATQLASQSSALVDGPDLVVQSVSGPASSYPGSSFNVSLTVCNQGNEPASATTAIFLSTDATITPADTQVGEAGSQWLMPGACATVTTPAGAYVPDGAYSLGAIIDLPNAVLEQDETNNARTGNQLGVGWRPDFVIPQVSGPPSTLPGAPLTVSVVLCNQGTTSDWVPAEIYLSTDATITDADFYAGSLAGSSPLWPGACATLTGTVWVNAPDGVYYLGAIADRPNYSAELIEDNNARAGSRIGVGNAPDLAIGSVSSDPSVMPGGPLNVSVSLCNQGTQPSTGPVDVYLSTDGDITTSDFWLGKVYPSGPIPTPVACSTLTGSLPANVPDGVYFVGAIADRDQLITELIEDNNAGAGNRVGVGYAPDLIVTSVVGPTSAYPWSGANVSVTLCNQGTAPTSAPVDVYYSTDATITASDSFAGTFPPSQYLMPGACATVSGNLPINVPDGVYFVGAIADRGDYVSELIEDNNTKAGNRVGVGYGPDLVISQVSSAPSAIPGGPLSFTLTVCNQGTQPGSAPVDLYLSGDANITDTDFWVGSLPPNQPLMAGACTTLTSNSYASVPDGVYFAGAIVDRPNYMFELIEDNNATAGNRVGVGYGPDLVISQVSSAPSTIPGGPLAVTVTVCNQGTQPGGAPVDLYLSSDANITDTDFWMGSVPPGPSLMPGACTILTSNANAPVPDGVYFVGAIADRNNSVFELIEDNNAKAGNRVGVGNAPDLIVTSVVGPTSAFPWSGANVSVTVCNQGTAATGAPVDVYYSTDATITASDSFAGVLPPGSYLMPGACATVSGNLTVPVPDGIYYVGAIVDRGNSVSELIEDNNTKAGNRVGVGYGPDLVISQVSAPAGALPGSQVPVTATVCNQGTQPGSAPVELFFSGDDTITSDDFFAGYLPPGPYLMPGACATLSGQAYVPGPEGTYFVGAIVDRNNYAFELIEDNNARAGNRVGVGFKPDLTVSQVSTAPSAIPGGPAQVTATVCNQGTQPGSAPVELFFSSDATITGNDFFAGTLPPGAPLMPGTCATLTGQASVPGSDGVYSVGAIIDRPGYVDELLEDNNAAAGNRVAVGYGPDFTVTEVSTAPGVTPGGQLQVTATVCNQGTQPGNAPVELFFSTDATITGDDQFAGMLPPGQYLMPGACATQTGTASAPYSDGVYYVGAIADRNNSIPELLEDNNATAGNRVGVGYGPDFVITQVSSAPSAMPGFQLPVTVTVCNQGTASGWASVNFFLSSDANIDGNDYASGTLPPGPPLAAGECSTRTGTAYVPGPEGVYYVGAIADWSDSTLELIEDNNAKAGNRVGIGYGADFTISQVSTVPSAFPGNSVQVSVTLCNQGTQPGSASVDLFFSTDATITPSDHLGGSIGPLSYLSPGVCITLSGPASTPSSPEGAYHVGAIADAFNSAFELIEDNNTKAGNRVGVGYGPDLVVSQISAPPSGTPGSPIQVSVTVCNQGTQPGDAPVDLFFSSDATITSGDFFAGSLPPGGPLAPGACITRSGPASAPPGPDGVYFVGAIADAPGSVYELLEDNNAKAGNRVGIGYAPDLIVTSVSGPASSQSWSQAWVTATVCNQGTDGADSGPIDIVLSGDATITDQDTSAGTIPSSAWLDPGACLTASGQVYLSNGPGTYWLGAISDRYNSSYELREDNNALAGGTIQLQ